MLVCVNTLYGVRTTKKSPNDAFLETHPRRLATHNCNQRQKVVLRWIRRTTTSIWKRISTTGNSDCL